MRRLRIAVPAVAGVCVLLACASAPPPAVDSAIRASSDPRVIERGRHLVRGPAHCADCHGDPAARQTDAGDIPLSGGRRFELGLAGTLVAPNLTSDVDAGIGAWSDADLVQALRYRRSRDGRPLAPLMEFQGLSDDDLRAVISYLRTLPPDARRAPPSELSLLGEVGLRLIVGAPKSDKAPPVRASVQHSADYGRYLADEVANCDGCHTRRSRLTGAYVGPAYGGGMKFDEGGLKFESPDITTSGALARLTEDDFVATFRARGQRASASPMPWSAYAHMKEEDLRSIYRYLLTVTPVAEARDRRKADHRAGARASAAPAPGAPSKARAAAASTAAM